MPLPSPVWAPRFHRCAAASSRDGLRAPHDGLRVPSSREAAGAVHTSSSPRPLSRLAIVKERTSAQEVGKTGGRPDARLYKNCDLAAAHPAFFVCVRSATLFGNRAESLCARSSTHGPYCPRGTLWPQPPRATGFVDPPPEAPISPRYERLRSVPGRRNCAGLCGRVEGVWIGIFEGA